MRICLVAEANPFGWTQYYRRALQEIGEVFTIGPHPTRQQLTTWGLADFAHRIVPNDYAIAFDEMRDLPSLLPPQWKPDLLVTIASGGVPVFKKTWQLSCPSVFISVDTWQCFVDYEDARYYDFVFCAQRPYVKLLAAAGAYPVHWLPLACDPILHAPTASEPEADLSFVGGLNAVFHRRRLHSIDLLQQHFSMALASRVYDEEYRRAMARGKVVFNHSAINDLNMRVFETLAMGLPLLSNQDAEGLESLFESGRHLQVFQDDQDLLKQAHRLLENDALRKSMAQEGREAVLGAHTYRHRMETVLETVREAIPAFGSPSLTKRLEKLGSWFPRGRKSVVDLGLSSGQARYALRSVGIQKFIAMPFSGQDCKKDLHRYDEMMPFGCHEEPERIEGAVLFQAIAGMPPLKEMLAYVWELLVPGGVFSLSLPYRIMEEEFQYANLEELALAMRHHDFHMIRAVRSGEDLRCILRKRTRTLRRILEENQDWAPLEAAGMDAQAFAGIPEEA